MKKILSCLFFVNISFSQQIINVYENGIDIIINDLNKENSEYRYYLQYDYPVEDKSNNLYQVVPNCDADLSIFKQSNEISRRITVSENAKRYFIKNNFFNRVFFGKRIRKIKVSKIYYSDSSFLFKINISSKDESFFAIVIFDKHNDKIINICKSNWIN